MEGGIEEPPMVGQNIGVIMKLGVLKEPADETRVAIVPTSMKKLLKAGFEVITEPLKINWNLTVDTEAEAFNLGKTIAQETL